MKRRDAIIGLSFFGLNAASPKELSQPLESQPEFRKLGGKVVAFMFGCWENQGLPYNPSPWYWINRYAKDRIPQGSKAIAGSAPRWILKKNGPHDFKVVAVHSQYNDCDKFSINSLNGRFTVAYGGAPSHFSTGEVNGFRLTIEIFENLFLRAELTLEIYDLDEECFKKFFIVYGDEFYDNGVLNVNFSAAEKFFEGKEYSNFNAIITAWSLDILTDSCANIKLPAFFDFDLTEKYKDQLRQLRGMPSELDTVSEHYLNLAQRSGIDAFFLCFFWDGERSFNHRTITSMLRCSNKFKTKTCLFLDTTASTKLRSISDLNKFAKYVAQWITKSQYWHYQSSPVLGFLGNQTLIEFFSQCDGVPGATPIDRCRSAMDLLRRKLAELVPGSSPFLFVSCNMAGHPDLVGYHGGPSLLDYLGFDTGTVYNQFVAYGVHEFSQVRQEDGRIRATGLVSGTWPANLARMSYSTLAQVYAKVASWILQGSGNRLHYWVPAIVGWDSRPWSWHKEVRLNNPCSDGLGCEPTQFELASHFMWARDMSINAAKTFHRPPVVCVYAWDEFGEGGYLCPTDGDVFSKLEVLKKVFNQGEL